MAFLSGTTTTHLWGRSPVSAWYRTRWICEAGSGRGFGAPRIPKFKYTGVLKPGKLSPPRRVPVEISRPSYAEDGRPRERPPMFPWEIEVKSAEAIEAMRVAGRVAREVLDEAARIVRTGITTDEIDALVHDATLRRGAYPSPLNYNKFPKSCCTSINEVICHGIPDSTVLRDGDIINIDVTCYVNGFHGDCSETFLVGDVDEAGRTLVRVTWECMDRAIAICKPGVPYHRVGAVIEEHAHLFGFKSVPQFCGHGIGKAFHTTPNVLHYKNVEPNGVMAPGHTFTIEPMLVEGSASSVTWPDNWTATTTDGKRSAQFEHTLLITEDGVERLTGRLPDSPPLPF
eukprot:CAMPEP_0184678370 /NCGR_PEP_ID=MMETSP0312-20130426/1105_1 /TAXON_ID=31354 /ORGANISM="Compsopogon coeruleus, Strain SAG 36.94" /LENGTH=342 /DNA_ID=CAMNT_0027127061 /DNA_START=935 /DNA_END=1963 /DNA_ORIENTATION=+